MSARLAELASTSMSLARFALALCAMAAAAACGDAPVETASSTCSCEGRACGDDGCGASCGACGDGTTCFGGQCIDAAECDVVGFAPTAESVFTRRAGGQQRLHYVATTKTVSPPFDMVVIDLDHAGFFPGGVPAAGTYDLAGLDGPTCSLCVRGFGFCNDQDCFNKFVAKEGRLTLSETGEPGTPFVGRLDAVKFQQIRITDSGQVTPHPSGKTWCLDQLAFSQDVPPLPDSSSTCVAPGTGTKVGDNIGDFALTNCLGEEVALHARCGAAKALWVVAVAGWCGACESFVPYVAQQYAERSDDGLEIMIVLGEDNHGGKPSLDYCKAYASHHGVDPRLVFVDHGTSGWQQTFSKIETYSGGTLGLPWNALLDATSMEYVWSTNAGTGDLAAELDALLQP